MGLNTEQLQAVNSNSDRILCLAGAGSGKTFSLVERITRMVNDGIFPGSILVLTFTNAAAAEMKSRYEAKNVGKVVPEFRTFHAFCYSIMCKDAAIRNALGYTTPPDIASDAQEKSIQEQAKAQCKITMSKEKLTSRENLTRDEQRQAELYDKAVNRLMLMNGIITFDALNEKVSALFVQDHPATKKYKDQYSHIALDECLPSCMSVLTENGWYSIDKLYTDFNAGIPLPLVKSYNVETSIYEYKPIIGVLRSDNREIFEIHTEGLNKIQCTANHKLYTQRGYVEARELVVGQDMVILDSPDKQKTKYLLNEDQYQICLGSYLGDGHVAHMSKYPTYRLTFTQGVQQQEYFKSKISAFGLDYRIIKSGYTDNASILQTSPTPIFALRSDIFDCVLKDISPLGLAIWYQDDGSLRQNKYICIYSNAFTQEEHVKIITMLKERFDIEAKIGISKKKYYYLRMDAANSAKFLDLVSPYMHPSMQYKTPIDISSNEIRYNSAYQNIGANFIDKITYIGTDTVYDITVADNHNFITSKSAHRVDNKTGTIVHNCQDTDRTQMMFLNSFPDTNFFFVGDTLQNLYSFRGTSNEYIKALANSDGWEVIKLFTNYRSTNQICEFANKFSATYADPSYRIEMKGIRDGERVHKRFTEAPVGFSPINSKSLDDVAATYAKLDGTSAILCRTNKEVAAVASYLTNHEIEFTTNHESKLTFYIACALSETYTLECMASYLSSDKYGEYIRLAAQTKRPDLAWFLKLYGKTQRIKDDIQAIEDLTNISVLPGTTAEKLNEVSKRFNINISATPDKDYFGDAFLKYLQDITSTAKSSELYVGTIHSVKGLEYDNVFVMNVGSYNFKLNNEDMKNLFYVAITRAKNRLYVYELFD